jgi:hypothetical protein
MVALLSIFRTGLTLCDADYWETAETRHRGRQIDRGEVSHTGEQASIAHIENLFEDPGNETWLT